MLPVIVSESIILKKATIEEMGGKNSSINMREKKHVAILILIFTARKRKFAKVMFLQVSVCPQGGCGCLGRGRAWLPGGVHGCWGGMCGCWGACVVAGGACMVAGGHVWLLGGLHGCWGCA